MNSQQIQKCTLDLKWMPLKDNHRIRRTLSVSEKNDVHELFGQLWFGFPQITYTKRVKLFLLEGGEPNAKLKRRAPTKEELLRQQLPRKKPFLRQQLEEDEHENPLSLPLAL
jgi:hypothetical protein